MRRASLLILLVPLLLLLLPTAAAEDHIGGTPVQLIPIDKYAKEAEWGSTAVFEFGVFNEDNVTSYQIIANATVSDSVFSITIFPTNFTLANSTFRRIFVNVSALGGTGRMTAQVNLQITVLGPPSGSGNFSATLDAVPKTTVLDVVTSFIAIGSIILIGFSAQAVFEKTGIPDIVFLIFLGLFLGPIAATYLGLVLVSPSVLHIVTPYIAGLALVIILFDGGLNLNLDTVIRKLGITSLHTIVTFTLNILLVALVAYYILGYPLLVGLLLGVVIGGTSGAVVITLARRMHAHEDTKTIVVLESVVTDVLCVILALSIIEFLRGGPDASIGEILPALAAGFSIAIVVALIFGIFWLRLLTRFSGRPFAYMVTIAAVLLLYACVELVGGSGPAAALVFGLVLGNHEEMARMLKVKSGFVLDDKIKHFQMELTFVVRTFFFVFLGLVFTLNAVGNWNVNTDIPLLSGLNGSFWLLVFGVVLIFLGFIFVRYLTSTMTARIHKVSRNDKGAIWSMMGRGLAAAVLASLPFTVSAYTSPSDPAYGYYNNLLAPYEPQFLNIAFIIILLTVLATTIAIAYRERKIMSRPPPSAEEIEKAKHRQAVDDWKKMEAKQYRERVKKMKKWRERDKKKK